MAGVLLFGLFAGPASGGDAGFLGTEIPDPPATHEKWKPLEEPKLLPDVTQLLFGLGMADPRGCEYRQIQVMTGNVWGNRSGRDWSTDGTVMQTHGWVLPADAKSAQRFAVCWNGLVYPVLAVGELCDVDEDVRKQVQPPEQGSKDSMRRFWRRGAVDERYSLSFETPLPLKSVLLMRLGKAELASAVWEASHRDPSIPRIRPPEKLSAAYEEVAVMWLFSLFNRAICAQMRGDDELALLSLRQLAGIAPEARKQLPGPSKTREPGDDPFGFLKEVPKYLADMERRRDEPPHKSALETGRDKFPDKAAWIKALVADLEDVRAQQDGQPGWVRLDENATVKALVREGNDAVEPLIDCLEHDGRYTRAVHFWRDFSPSRTVLGTQEAAYTALTGIFKTTFFDIRSTGQDLTNSGPEARAKVAAAIRAYWEKRKGASLEEQWFITLADDNAKPEEWAAAAANIAKSGNSLREKNNPDVTGLLKKRIKALSTENMGNGWRPQPAPQLADALLTWGGAGEADAVREFCNAMAGRYSVEKVTGGIAPPLIALTERLAKMGDKKILDDYANWLRIVPPERVGDHQAMMQWFKPLWENPDAEAIQKSASEIFAGKDSAWRYFIREKLGSNEVLAMLRSPLIGVRSFREILLAGLADRTPAGETGYLAGDFWMARFGFGEKGTQVMASLNPLDPLSKNAPGYGTFRTCDLYAGGLAEAQGMPALQFYWPEEARDAAVAIAVQTLRRYGERYRVTAENPVRENFRHGPNSFTASLCFAKLDRPATQEDVQNGLAIFSLPADAKARVCEAPHDGAKARWLAVKDFSHNEGHSDPMGRQWTTTEYENGGRVWQAEEGFVDGKWRRFFGFTGDHCIARAPAEEIEFPETSGPPSAGTARQDDHPAGADIVPMLGSLPAEDLIAKLQDESAQGIGTHATALASGFMAIDDEPRFEMGILGSRKPEASPVMRELVRRGVAALPLLLEHLDDSRPTKLTVGDGFMGKWFSDEYEPRVSGPDREPRPGTTTDRQFQRYTVQVGDFCFAAIGQIVNRGLNAVRYQPTLCLVINSPVETPALAAAARKDWSGLTPPDHRRSLEKDALNIANPTVATNALKRLLFYYPDAGKPLQMKFLRRPFYDSRLAYDFFINELAATNENTWDARIARFRKEHGETNYQGVLRWIVWAATFPEAQETPERTRNKQAAKKLLARYFPDLDLQIPPFIDAVSTSQQKILIEGLAAFQTKEIDEAILDVFRRLSLIIPTNREEEFEHYALADACAKRLAKRAEEDTAFRAIFQKSLSEFLKSRPRHTESQGADALRKELEKLGKRLENFPR